MRPTRWYAMFVALLVAWATLSCAPKAAPGQGGSSTSGGSAVGEKTQVAQDAATARAVSGTPAKPLATSKGGAPTNAPLASGQGDEVAFGDVGKLDKLKSYRLVNKWSGNNEKGELLSWESSIEFVRDPPAEHHILTSSQGGKAQKPMETIRIGDAHYVDLGDGQWMATQQKDQEQNLGALISPEAYIGSEKGKLVGKETVNGVATKHYRYDTRTLNPALKVNKLDEYKADVWVSEEFGVYVRTIIHIVGADINGAKYTYDLESNLSDINKPITIQAPAGVKVPKLPDDVPVMAGATNQSTLGGDDDGSTMTSYQVAKSPDEVRKFYQEQMKTKGWAAEESALDKVLQYRKAGREAQVIISEQSGGCSVVLSVQASAAAESAAKPSPTKAAATGAKATEKPAPTDTPEPNLVADIPLMAGATVTDKGNDYLTYGVKKPLADVAEFYKSRLPAAGWALEDASEDGAYLLFRKQGRVATFSSEEGDGQTMVNISVTPE